MKFNVLVIGLLPEIKEYLNKYFQYSKIDIEEQRDVKKALELIDYIKPKLIFIDNTQSNFNGIKLCAKIQKLTDFKSTIKVVVDKKSIPDNESDALDSGADDYITIPIKMALLIARLKAWLRRINIFIEQNEYFFSEQNKSLSIDKTRYLITKDGDNFSLPKKEFEILSMLAAKPNCVFTREEIFANIWGDDLFVGIRTIDVHIRKLREKIGNEYIHTIKGVGYKYVP